MGDQFAVPGKGVRTAAAATAQQASTVGKRTLNDNDHRLVGVNEGRPRLEIM